MVVLPQWFPAFSVSPIRPGGQSRRSRPGWNTTATPDTQDFGPLRVGLFDTGARRPSRAGSRARTSIEEDTMTTIGRGAAAHHLEKVEAPGSMLTKTAAKALAVLRISTGFIFLWAFLDKTFGFGYATPSAKAWIHGGSPTKGFLAGVDVGPSGLQTFFHNIAGDPWANWLFMLGLLGVGAAFILGIGMRLAAGAAVAMMAMMWLAEFPLDKTAAAGKPS